jgi:hypothetical protein
VSSPNGTSGTSGSTDSTHEASGDTRSPEPTHSTKDDD